MIDKDKLKEKLPDLDEVTHMTSKLFTDLKKSVHEIYSEYKEKRTDTENGEADKQQPSDDS